MRQGWDMVHGDRVENVESGNTMTREIREDVRNISGTCNWLGKLDRFLCRVALPMIAL